MKNTTTATTKKINNNINYNQANYQAALPLSIHLSQRHLAVHQLEETGSPPCTARFLCSYYYKNINIYDQ